MKIHYFALLGMLLAACSPNDSSQKPSQKPTVHSLVFLDKSVSVNANESFVNEKYKRVLLALIEENFRQKGDNITVYYLHENTAKAKAWAATCKTEREDPSNLSPTDAEALQTAFDLALSKEQKRAKQACLQQLSLPNARLSNQATDITATLGIINTVSQENDEVKVYYFSDMVESMKGSNRRDFHKHPPQNITEAQTWAKADAQSLRKLYDNLSTAEVKMILPFEPTSSTQQNNPSITAYWQQLFEALGLASVEELF